MQKALSMMMSYQGYTFLIITTLVSLFSFTLMKSIPSAQTPNKAIGLVIWLVAIWSPNIAAIIIWGIKKEIHSQIKLAFSFSHFSWWMLLSTLPLLVCASLLIIEHYKGNHIVWNRFQLSYLGPFILINLIMGPIGEELGWRSFLYPLIRSQFGWMGAALFVGFIWASWHAPLWWIDSPQAKIPFWAFSMNVICLSILMGMIYNHSNGSILPIIFLHLTFNLSAGLVDIIESHKPAEFFIKSLYFYIPTTIILLGIHEYLSKGYCHSHTPIQ